MQKITLTQVTRLTTNKDGSPLKTRDGRPYTRLLLKCKEYAQQSISMFDNEQTKDWKEGMEVELNIEKVKVGDREFLNGSLPKKEDKTNAEIAALGFSIANLNRKVDSIINHLSGKDRLDTTSTGDKIPDFSEVDQIFDR
ncbi:MAG: hypothetical protein U1E54_03375 [Candidatus Levybacteria bacterium]|nr:hypothetical protein [Candidatus Levybacteria bacterium]